MFNTFPMTFFCSVCGAEQQIVSIDNICSTECRKKAHDTKKCCKCGRPYIPDEAGWDVPTFEWYMSISYLCPDCKEKKRQKDLNYIKRLKEIPIEIKELESKIKLRKSFIEEYNGELVIMYVESYTPIKEVEAEIRFYKKNREQLKKDRELRTEIYYLKEEYGNIPHYIKEKYK